MRPRRTGLGTILISGEVEFTWTNALVIIAAVIAASCAALVAELLETVGESVPGQ